MVKNNKISNNDDNNSIKSMLQNITPDEAVDDNESLDDSHYLDGANENFSEILRHYVRKIKESYNSNKIKKEEYYTLFKRIFISSYIAFILSTVVCLVLYLIFEDIAIFSVMIPFFLEALSVTIIIPKIIAEYLFNTEEEKNLSEVINNIQKHNESVRNNSRNK